MNISANLVIFPQKTAFFMKILKKFSNFAARKQAKQHSHNHQNSRIKALDEEPVSFTRTK